MLYERECEGTDLFGFDFIDFKIHLGRKQVTWTLYINRNREEINEINKISIVERWL